MSLVADTIECPSDLCLDIQKTPWSFLYNTPKSSIQGHPDVPCLIPLPRQMEFSCFLRHLCLLLAIHDLWHLYSLFCQEHLCRHFIFCLSTYTHPPLSSPGLSPPVDTVTLQAALWQCALAKSPLQCLWSRKLHLMFCFTQVRGSRWAPEIWKSFCSLFCKRNKASNLPR